MGERELILDGMSVEEVMRILGAKGAEAKDTGSPSRRSVEPREPSAATTARVDDVPAESSDWRSPVLPARCSPITCSIASW